MADDALRTRAERTAIGLTLLIGDGDAVVVGVNTPLATAAYFLAKAVHAPRAWLYSGCAADVEPHPLSFFDDEVDGAAAASGQVSYDFTSFYLRQARRLGVEAVRPLQVGADGSVNASGLLIGGAVVPIAGLASVPEILGLAARRACYLPEHSRRAFPERVDAVTMRPADLDVHPIDVATELGSFRLHGDGELEIVGLWPDVDAATVAERTGFPVRLAADVRVLPAEPYEAVLRKLDPRSTILLEVLGRRDRPAFLRGLRTR